MIDEFIQWLNKNEWHIELNDKKFNVSSNEVLNKFNCLPQRFVELLERCRTIESNDATIWFLCGGDYKTDSGDAFKWNEFELLSLDAAQGDEKRENKILNWWSDKLPIILSVRDGYSFYAIDLGSDSGAVIRGEEPEFEEAHVVADSFDSFLKKIMDKTILL